MLNSYRIKDRCFASDIFCNIYIIYHEFCYRGVIEIPAHTVTTFTDPLIRTWNEYPFNCSIVDIARLFRSDDDMIEVDL